MITYEIASRDGDLSKKDWAKIGSAAAYTGNALMAVFVETGWVGVKNLGVIEPNGDYIKLTERSAAHWRRSANPLWGNLIKGFGGKLVGLGGFAVVAAALEWWDIEDDYREASSSADKQVMLIKKYAVGGMLVIGSLQVLAGVAALAGSGALAAVVMAPWFLGITALVGLIYIFSTLAINHLKRDVVGHWLHRCRWSRHPAEHFSSELEENQTFLEIQLGPAVFAKSTFEVAHYYSQSVGSVDRETQNGVWVQLLVPEAMRGQFVNVNIAASGRPFPGFPVEIIGGTLKGDFIANGFVENVDQWRKAPAKKKHSLFNNPPPETVLTTSGDIVWQAWLPVGENARYLELQVWYPAEILTVRESDKGYRYQIALAIEGQSDNGESRVVGSNENSLQVESLGGRHEGVKLPIPL
jgi:hypothetical protein